jgi:hypothetical protein
MTEPVARQHGSLNLGEVHAVAKYLSLISLVPEWAGTNKSCPLHEFIKPAESAAYLGNWSDGDKVRVTLLKLTYTARLFFNTTPKLHATDVSWVTFMAAVRDHFHDPRTDQYHYK